MATTYKALSINGRNTYSLDFTNYLKPDELVVVYSLTPEDDEVLKVELSQINKALYLNDDMEKVEINKGLIFELKSIGIAETIAYIVIDFEGNLGSKNSFRKAVPIETNIEN